MIDIRNDAMYKRYKSKDGRKVTILTAFGPDKEHPVVVAYQNEEGGCTYDSVTNDGREFAYGEDGLIRNPLDTENDLEEVTEITVKQTFVWKGTPEALKNHIFDVLEPTHCEDGVEVSEFREVIE